MLLKKIKLAGFKSFVDPTVIPLPSQLVAIVGPNGCGKSNIIDAVCWVMGETSAKHLRGELLTDVIFNGSNTRKPIGQASVELIFDNQDGSLGGEYASYAEISIRRLITREGESVYFLNGARCRRRDIVDIFLGTGIGPRSYSIIAQNMISRIIEAKPDELRIYLEEAAGVSKYKERRRETENRIQHTKDNLARLNDIRMELEKQLEHLKRQASAAEKFKSLKQEERLLRSHFYGVQWKQYTADLANGTLHIQREETALEAKQLELNDIIRMIEKDQNQREVTQASFQKIQQQYYVIGNDITRLEQDIHYHQERRGQWEVDVATVESDSVTVKNDFDQVIDDEHEFTRELAKLQPAFIQSKEKSVVADTALSSAEKNLQDWQGQWDTFNQTTAKTTQTAQVEQTRIQHIEQKMLALQQLQKKREEENKQIHFSAVEEEIEKLTKKIEEMEVSTASHEKEFMSIKQKIVRVKQDQDTTTTTLDQTRNTLQQLRGEEASLEALQQTALGQRQDNVVQWLSTHDLHQQPRLAKHIVVESGWEQAVEKVLGIYLQAICVNDLHEAAQWADQFKEGQLCLVAATTPSHKKIKYKATATALIEKITSPYSLASLLDGIYIAESYEEAVTLLDSLEDHESVITQDGTWFGPSWVQLSREEDPKAGIFQREKALIALQARIESYSQQQKNLEKTITEHQAQLQVLENEQEGVQKKLRNSQDDLSEMRLQKKMKHEKVSELQKQSNHLRQELQDTITESEQAAILLKTTREHWQQAMEALEKLSLERDNLLKTQNVLRDTLQQKRLTANQMKEDMHQWDIRFQTTQSQLAGLEQNKTRLQAQMNTLELRKTTLQKEANAFSDITSLEKGLAEQITKRLHVEEELNEIRNRLSAIEHALRDSENERRAKESVISAARDSLEKSRLELQTLKIKSETIVEQVNESGLVLDDILKTLADDAVASQLQMQIEQVGQRIARLGAINLIAIEEYTSCSERKNYLDKQYEDLIEGLNTLEAAIAKIDKETRTQFKETFEKVNTQFQTLFPAIFGGGRAYLELIGENLLDAGVSVMACPPGKRNSSIHLLSGGEKAMTAIALVFSIFHLNPAPFCLLDEVDAPLDDVNVGRFCQLVKNMSQKTQFIFISHNKLTIAMGEQLMGVTMQEPGVSRLVSVSLKEAIDLVDA